MSYEILAKNAPRDKEVILAYGHALSEAGEGQRAEKVLLRDSIIRAYPTDNEISQALKNLSARATMGQGGYEQIASGKGSYRDMLRDEKGATAMEQENRVQKSEKAWPNGSIGEYECVYGSPTSPAISNS